MSQIESTVKASMLDLKNSFFGHKLLPFSRHIGVFLPFENGSAIEKKNRSALLQKRTQIEFPLPLMRSAFGFYVDSTLYLGHIQRTLDNLSAKRILPSFQVNLLMMNMLKILKMKMAMAMGHIFLFGVVYFLQCFYS